MFGNDIVITQLSDMLANGTFALCCMIVANIAYAYDIAAKVTGMGLRVCFVTFSTNIRGYISITNLC